MGGRPALLLENAEKTLRPARLAAPQTGPLAPFMDLVYIHESKLSSILA